MKSVALKILWPAFVATGVMGLLFFAHADPDDVHTLAGAPIELLRQAVHTLSFFGFWAVIAAAGAVSGWLQQRADD